MELKKPAMMIVFVLNALFWILLSVFIWINAVPFKDRKPDFEKIMPAYKFGNWAVPPELESDSLPFRIVLSAYRPSFGVTSGLTNWINSNSGRTWETRLGNLSIGAWVLIGTMLLSFVQWYLTVLLMLWVGAAFGKLMHRLAGSSERNTGQLP